MIYPLAAVDPISDSLLNYGFAGALLLVLFWFLRALVTLGVKPFVESTLQNQVAMANAMEKIREATERTALVVAEIASRLLDHTSTMERRYDAGGCHTPRV